MKGQMKREALRVERSFASLTKSTARSSSKPSTRKNDSVTSFHSKHSKKENQNPSFDKSLSKSKEQTQQPFSDKCLLEQENLHLKQEIEKLKNTIRVMDLESINNQMSLNSVR